MSRPPPCGGFCRWGWCVNAGLWAGMELLVWWLMG